MSHLHCPVCEHILQTNKSSWHYMCGRCQYEGSTLEPKINDPEFHLSLNEENRENALESLRKHNFAKILDTIGQFKSSKAARMLDVGSAHGWFIEMAADRYDVSGIEPDEKLYQYSLGICSQVSLGYFPDGLSNDASYDIIVFNDVLEHIPDVNSLLNDCSKRLNDDGLLVINLPISTGIFYRTAKLLSRFGLVGPFNRMWQLGFPSPHVHYFNVGNLERLAARHKFEKVHTGYLKTLSLAGLKTRLQYSTNSNKIYNSLLYSAIIITVPFLAFLPKDIAFSIYKKKQ